MPNVRSILTVLAAILLRIAAVAQQPHTHPPVSVMIVGNFHMSNPGHDIHNVTVDDVLLPEAQAQITRVTDALAAFHPTSVMVEWPAPLVDERYPTYLAGTLPPSHNEVVQLGFRLARTAGLKRVFGIDADGDFPYEPVETFAREHGHQDLLDDANAQIEASAQAQTAMLKSRGIAATLRYLNDPELLKSSNSFYREILRFGDGTQQPGADLLTAWYRRNFLICANLIQNSHPGDHIVVFYGSGHAFLLRQCVAETPGFLLVEPNRFLPQ